MSRLCPDKFSTDFYRIRGETRSRKRGISTICFDAKYLKMENKRNTQIWIRQRRTMKLICLKRRCLVNPSFYEIILCTVVPLTKRQWLKRFEKSKSPLNLRNDVIETTLKYEEVSYFRVYFWWWTRRQSRKKEEKKCRQKSAATATCVRLRVFVWVVSLSRDDMQKHNHKIQ